tara:strand:- start:406 stop:630 length:225 start_codon:yes stop_codon:yes gene_type:complete
MKHQDLIKAILGQSGALVLACIALYYISQLYVEQIDSMMERCQEDREEYYQQMSSLTSKIDTISSDVKDIKAKQ